MRKTVSFKLFGARAFIALDVKPRTVQSWKDFARDVKHGLAALLIISAMHTAVQVSPAYGHGSGGHGAWTSGHNSNVRAFKGYGHGIYRGRASSLPHWPKNPKGPKYDKGYILHNYGVLN